MDISDSYRDLKNFSSFTVFKEFGIAILKETIETFLNCEISFMYEPVKQAEKKLEIKLLENPKRGCYPLNDDTFFIYARVLDSDTLVSGIGMVLKGKNISKNASFLNYLEGAITKRLSHSFNIWFEDCSLIFGDDLIKHAICNYCVRGYIDYRKFHHLITFFDKLRSTTFENKSFKTGLIITRSHFAFKNKEKYDRYGQIYPLKQKESLLRTLQINRRFWYLSDGIKTFFVCNKDLEVQHLFVLDEKYADLDYIENHTLSSTLKGGDTLFKIENNKQFSIINSDGTEFLYLENKWKMRNYNSIKELLSVAVIKDKAINKLLYYVLLCSKKSISTLIWIPENLEDIDQYVKPNTLNSLIYDQINILDNRFSEHIIRYLSSDGATVIDMDGNVHHYGCIVDIKNLNVKGVKGTGESAAEMLSKNGISIKVSEDGSIKLFYSDTKPPVLI